ncbi:MAG TPA: hypothetical protein DCO75_02060 [Fibrobacteres bacterium]|jgi:putative MATE family efflux protein|nr:hypothetical protein [Fibrobacterota bacterium]
MSKLITDSVAKTIVRMALPMLAGTFAINMYNLTNAWFVSRLGTNALAAISFTFPVIMLISFVIRGFGSGAMTLVAQAFGAKDKNKASELTFHALLFAAFFAVVISVTGIITIKPVFSRLGASGEVLVLIDGYMKVWYLGAIVMALQMIASDIIIGTGATKAISALMVGGTVVNVLLDIVFIFGAFGIPGMGIVGAAVSTILAQGASLVGALYILHYKLRMIDLHALSLKNILVSWGKILSFGIPGALGMVLTPIASAVIIKLVSAYGATAVAASGVAGRIEMFAFMIPMTVGMSLIPFIAQNYGAKRIDRILTARSGAIKFALIYGVFIAAVFLVIINPVSKLFSNDPAVIAVLRHYIFITCAGYGFLEVHRYAGFCMTGVSEPVQATILNIIRVICLLIPLSILGGRIFHLDGVFIGRLVADIAAGCIGILWSRRILNCKSAAH